MIMTPTMQNLPAEIILLIIEKLPNSATLLASILTCRHVYNSVKPHVPSVLKSIIVSQIDSLYATSNVLFTKLQDQSRFLMQTLVALRSIAQEYRRDLLMLELPLQCCDLQCASISVDVSEYALQTKNNSTQSWDDWRDVISRYNSTFKVALGKSTLQEYSVDNAVLQLYQRLIEEAKCALESEVESPIVAGHHLQKIRGALAQEQKSIKLCLNVCNHALELTKSGDLRLEMGRPADILSITELLPEEKCHELFVLDRL